MTCFPLPPHPDEVAARLSLPTDKRGPTTLAVPGLCTLMSPAYATRQLPNSPLSSPMMSRRVTCRSVADRSTAPVRFYERYLGTWPRLFRASLTAGALGFSVRHSRPVLWLVTLAGKCRACISCILSDRHAARRFSVVTESPCVVVRTAMVQMDLLRPADTSLPT